MTLPHIGSWGTPDFGVTEALANLFGQGRTAQGGSNLRGPVSDTVLIRDENGGFKQTTQPISRPTTSSVVTGGGGSPQPENRGDGGNDGGGGGPSMEDVINSQYNSISSEMDRLIGWLPEWQKSLESNIGTMATSAKGDVEAARAKEMEKFPVYRQNVETNQKKTLSDLAANMRNVMKAGGIYLGSKGAADSTASKMFAFASGQQANRERGDVRAQTSSMLKEIDMKEADLNFAYDEQSKSIDDWKMSEISKITEDFNNKRFELMSQKPIIRQQAVDRWLNYLTDIDTRARAWQGDLDKWKMDRLATLDNFKVQIGNSTNFSPRELVFDEMRFSPGTGSTETASVQNPWLISKKKLMGDDGSV